jgi:peptidoglycan L-alanyl-D-glutamate endopeptidase CwlK
MASRRLTSLAPDVYPLAEKMFVLCDSERIELLCTCTLRSRAEQIALYAQGREPIEITNRLRAAAKMPLLASAESKKVVTHAKPGVSLHEVGRAFDIVPVVGGKLVWDSGNPLWLRIGEIGKSVGLEWAGDWIKFKEYPHFQKR